MKIYHTKVSLHKKFPDLQYIEAQTTFTTTIQVHTTHVAKHDILIGGSSDHSLATNILQTD